jgi:hypothetical protein
VVKNLKLIQWFDANKDIGAEVYVRVAVHLTLYCNVMYNNFTFIHCFYTSKEIGLE